MPKFRQARRGVAGFFEEVPAAVVAIIALILFFAAVLSGLTSYTSRQASSNFSQQAETFLEGLLSYHNITFRQQTGVFDVYAVMALTIANLTYDFHPPFQYSVTVTDISLYPVHYDKSLATSTFPTNSGQLQNGWVKDSTTVDLWVFNFPDDEYHAATLTVVIWS